MTTTPAPTRPTFTKNARGHYACPAPGCQRTFIAAAGAGRHWTVNHQVKPTTNGHEPEVDPFDLDHLRALADEVEQERAAEDDDEERDGLDGSTLYVNEDDSDPDPDDRARFEAHLAKYDTARILAGSMLTPEQVRERTPCACRLEVDAVLALSDATAGLVDAIVRLRNAGYPSTHATEVVLDLVDKLDNRPGAAA